MTLEKLQNDMKEAMKSGNHARKQVISDMIAAIKNASYTPKGKVEITDKLVDEVLIKYQKMVQEKIDTCPSDRLTTIIEYKDEMRVVKEYAPQLMTDPKVIKREIEKLAAAENISINAGAKALLMKKVMPAFKGKADLATVREVMEGMF